MYQYGETAERNKTTMDTDLSIIKSSSWRSQQVVAYFSG